MFDETMRDTPKMLSEIYGLIEQNDISKAEEKIRYIMTIFTKEFKMDLVMKGNEILKMLREKRIDEAKLEINAVGTSIVRNFHLQSR